MYHCIVCPVFLQITYKYPRSSVFKLLIRCNIQLIQVAKRITLSCGGRMQLERWLLHFPVQLWKCVLSYRGLVCNINANRNGRMYQDLHQCLSCILTLLQFAIKPPCFYICNFLIARRLISIFLLAFFPLSLIYYMYPWKKIVYSFASASNASLCIPILAFPCFSGFAEAIFLLVPVGKCINAIPYKWTTGSWLEVLGLKLVGAFLRECWLFVGILYLCLIQECSETQHAFSFTYLLSYPCRVPPIFIFAFIGYLIMSLVIFGSSMLVQIS